MYKEIEILNGNNRLVFQKRLLLASADPLSIKVLLDENTSLLLNFSFTNNEKEKPDFKIEHKTSNRQFIYDITLINFNNPFGTGLKKPVKLLGHNVNGTQKVVSLVFYVYKNGDSNPILDISLYEEV